MRTRSNRMRTLRVGLVALAALIGSAAAEVDKPQARPMIAVSAKSLDFMVIPDMPKCVKVAILRGKPLTEGAAVLLKLSTGCSVPWHWHTANESILVLSGQGKLEMKQGKPLAFAPGAYAEMPGRHVHRAVCTKECLLFSSADGPFDMHYVNDKGKEISLEKAMKRMSAPATEKTKEKTPTKKKE